MPIEIRELIIQARIGSAQNRQENGAQNDAQTQNIGEANLQIIVARVLEALKEQQER